VDAALFSDVLANYTVSIAGDIATIAHAGAGAAGGDNDRIKDFDLSQGDRIVVDSPGRDLENVRYIAGTGYRVDFTNTADHLIVESPEDPALADYLAHDLIFE
jgi:hypothetical protein